MSSASDEEDEEVDEEHKSIKGEAGGDHLSYQELQIEEVIIPKFLTFKEASNCLHMLGKDESGCRYAYLMITATDRNLTEISIILQFVHVLFLDLSGNKLHLDSLQILKKMPYLLYLKVERNIIETCELETFDLLQALNFARNKILKTYMIRQPMLECLNLNYNFIDEVELIQKNVPNLKLLEVRGNLIQSLRGIYPPSLDSLYLAENKIDYLDQETLDTLVNLRILHLRDNLIKKLDSFTDRLAKLKYLNLRKNNITRISEIGKLWILPELDTLIILQNPVGGDVDIEIPGEKGEDEEDEKAEDEEGEELGEGEEKLDKFRVNILIVLPNLKRINKSLVSAAERVSADMQRRTRYQEIMGERSASMLTTIMDEDSEYIDDDSPSPDDD